MPVVTARLLKAGVQFMNTINPLLDAVVGDIVGAEISKTKTDRAVFGVGNKNEIAAGINSIRF